MNRTRYHESLDHERYMRRAIELAGHAPGLPFGAVIVDGVSECIVAEGWNRSGENPTWHGEIVALNALFRQAGHPSGDRLTLYTTAEPCPMCMAAILWAGLGSVVFGTSIRFLIAHGWRQIDIAAEEVVRRGSGWSCTVIGGVLRSECDALFVGGPPGRG